MTRKTREEQYNVMLEKAEQSGISTFGLMTNQAWDDDPKRLAFTFSRYKFVAKMMSGKKRVLEIGCADAFATRIVQQEVQELTAIDFDPVFIEDVKMRMNPKWPMSCFVHDMLQGPPPGKYQGIYALDVLEHIRPHDESIFLKNMVSSLEPHGIAIVGMPSLESQAYASPISRAGHVNCKTMPELRSFLELHFHNVFVFSMNDEIVHTGYHKMAQYLMALCCDQRR
jgi:2-polyprenyl-3-methyl-5-hydroxy-6-metoxy-1,4-benzoquinol methylase